MQLREFIMHEAQQARKKTRRKETGSRGYVEIIPLTPPQTKNFKEIYDEDAR